MVRNFISSFSLIIMFVLSACRVMLIGSYDPIMDNGIQQVQQQVATLLVKINKNLLSRQFADNAYLKFKDEYADIEGKLKTLELRSRALPKYKVVTDQLVPFDSTIRKMERFHQLGFEMTDTGSLRIMSETVEFDFKQMIILQQALKNRSKNNLK